MGRRRRYAAVIALLAVAQAASLALARWAGEPEPEREVRVEVPLVVAGWRGEEAGALDAVTLDMAKPMSYLLRDYGREGRSLELVVLLGRAKTFHSPGMCLPAVGWSPLEKGTAALPGPGAEGVEAGRVLAQGGDGRRLLVMYLYVWPGGETASWLRFQLAMLGARLLGREPVGALVRVSAVLSEAAGEERASREMEGFLAAVQPHVRAGLRGEGS